MKNIKSKNKYYCLPAGRQGFSLIETLISVFLITVGLLATVALISKSMMESMDSRNQLIAGELAQEGIELVRNIRDNNWVTAGNTSFTGISTGTNGRIDKDSNLETTGVKILYNTGVFYVHSAVGTTQTKFRRRLMVVDSGVADKQITSIVTWGNTVPPTTIVGCNTASKCNFVQVVLTAWGE